MTVVFVESGEAIEQTLKRFKKECQKSGIPAELRKREHYEKPSVPWGGCPRPSTTRFPGGFDDGGKTRLITNGRDGTSNSLDDG